MFIEGQWLNPQEITAWLLDNQSFNNLPIESLNIYGCEFAKGTKGIEAVDYLEEKLGISIAASNKNNNLWSSVISGLDLIYSFDIFSE